MPSAIGSVEPGGNFYWGDTTKTMDRVAIVVREVFFGLVAASCFAYSSTIFFPSFLLGITFRDRLVQPFDRIHAICWRSWESARPSPLSLDDLKGYFSSWLNFTTALKVAVFSTLVIIGISLVVVLGSLWSHPSSTLTYISLMGLWSGKRLVELAECEGLVARTAVQESPPPLKNLSRPLSPDECWTSAHKFKGGDESDETKCTELGG